MKYLLNIVIFLVTAFPNLTDAQGTTTFPLGVCRIKQ